MLVVRLIAIVAALGLIGFGLVAMVAPTPLGFMVVGAGLVLLGWSFPEAVRRARRHWKGLDRQLDRLQARGPAWLVRLLSRSDPPD